MAEPHVMHLTSTTGPMYPRTIRPPKVVLERLLPFLEMLITSSRAIDSDEYDIDTDGTEFSSKPF